MGERLTLHNHWKPEMSAEEREALTAAWRGHRACFDCEHYEPAPTGKAGLCGSPLNRRPCASFIVPEDFSCEKFEAATASRLAERQEDADYYATLLSGGADA